MITSNGFYLNTSTSIVMSQKLQQAIQILQFNNMELAEFIKTESEKKAANLPQQMIDNIAKGRLQKFFKEQTLEDQEYVMVNKISVKDYIKSQDAEAKVLSFFRFTLND